MDNRLERGRDRLNPDGNERLTAVVGLVVLALSVVELATIVFGLHRFLSLHVFVGLVLIPPVLLKLASTGWRFARYYTGSEPYRSKGAPQLPMRLLAPLLVAATVVLLGSGVAMGIVHGQSLAVARRLHGPASVLWLILIGVHILVYLKRALLSSTQEVVVSSRRVYQGQECVLTSSPLPSAPASSWVRSPCPCNITGSICTTTTTAVREARTGSPARFEESCRSRRICPRPEVPDVYGGSVSVEAVLATKPDSGARVCRRSAVARTRADQCLRVSADVWAGVNTGACAPATTRSREACEDPCFEEEALAAGEPASPTPGADPAAR